MPALETLPIEAGPGSHELDRRTFLAATAAAMASLYMLPDEAAAFNHPLPSVGNIPNVPILGRETKMIKALNTIAFSPATNGDNSIVEFVNQGGAEAVVLWAPKWSKYEPEPGQKDKLQWLETDSNIAAAKALGKPIYLAVSCEYPLWAFRKPHHSLRIKDRSPRGPYAHFLEEIITRYPDLDGLIYLNEPNIAFRHNPKRAAHTADLLMTADTISRHHNFQGKILGPAHTDLLDKNGSQFFSEVLQHLWMKKFKPQANHAVAAHLYGDATYGTTAGLHRNLHLIDKGWKGADKDLYNTECGSIFQTHETKQRWIYDYDRPLLNQEFRQLRNLIKHYDLCRNSGRVAMWANYTLRDSQAGGGGFMSGLFRIDGLPHPVLSEWLRR